MAFIYYPLFTAPSQGGCVNAPIEREGQDKRGVYINDKNTLLYIIYSVYMGLGSLFMAF
jgi:hypothetical protein